MRFSLITIVVVGGCGNDIGLDAVDAAGVGGPLGSPMVTVTAPIANESFYPLESVLVGWTATDEDIVVQCDVTAVSGTTTTPVASAMQTTKGQATSAMWAIDGAPAGTYRIRVACTDSGNLTGANFSGAFNVSAPPQQVSYASQIQPLWNRSCNSMQCHDATMPAEGLNLTAAASHAELAGTSTQCTSFKLVEPTAPARSYLVMKLQGGGACFRPSRMPKGLAQFTTAELQLVRDWIYNGAPNN